MLKATKELLLSKANLLVVASALTSFVNLIAFLVIPVIFNAEDLAICFMQSKSDILQKPRQELNKKQIFIAFVAFWSVEVFWL